MRGIVAVRVDGRFIGIIRLMLELVWYIAYDV
jgi:hypothetical protein